MDTTNLTRTTPTTAEQLRWIRKDVEIIADQIVRENQRALGRLRQLADAIDQLERGQS